jgi:peptide/nickel transport system permease protein
VKSITLEATESKAIKPGWSVPSQPAAASNLDRSAGMVGLVLLAFFLLMAFFPDVVAPYDPFERVGMPLERPGPQFTLGTNDIGQDLVSELVHGTRHSLSTGLTVALLAICVGTIAGLVSGYSSGLASELIVRLIDLTLVLPFLPLVILLSAYAGPSQRTVILVLTLVFWAVPARVIRSQVLSLSRQAFVEAARALGSSDRRILRQHIWPGVRGLAFLQFTLIASAAILAEASLSFLGLGDPSAKSWGGTLYFARSSGAFLNDSWLWWVLPTGILITLCVLSLVLIGYSQEKRLHPHLNH